MFIRKMEKSKKSILCMIISMLMIVGYGEKNYYEATGIVQNTKIDSSQIVNIQIGAAGDVMAHSPQLAAQYDSESGEYDFTNNFEKVKTYVEGFDLSLVNLETTLSGGEYSSYPKFNTPDSIVGALKDTGFDVVSTINNHSADTGKTGIIRTKEVVDNHGLVSIGTRNNTDEKNYEVQEVEGVKIGTMAYSYGEIIDGVKYLNGLKVEEELSELTNIFDLKDLDKTFQTIKLTLDEMKSEGTDITLLSIHWGNEYQREANDFQKKLAQKLCDEGIDIIIGSHPHVVQPFDILQSQIEESHKTYCFYSLGNFISNQRKETIGNTYTADGVIPVITIQKEMKTNTSNIAKVEYIPTWTNKYFDEVSNKNVYEILPILNQEHIQTYDERFRNSLTESFQNTSDIITKYNNEIELYTQ